MAKIFGMLLLFVAFNKWANGLFLHRIPATNRHFSLKTTITTTIEPPEQQQNEKIEMQNTKNEGNEKEENECKKKGILAFLFGKMFSPKKCIHEEEEAKKNNIKPKERTNCFFTPMNCLFMPSRKVGNRKGGGPIAMFLVSEEEKLKLMEKYEKLKLVEKHEKHKRRTRRKTKRNNKGKIIKIKKIYI